MNSQRIRVGGLVAITASSFKIFFNSAPNIICEVPSLKKMIYKKCEI